MAAGSSSDGGGGKQSILLKIFQVDFCSSVSWSLQKKSCSIWCRTQLPHHSSNLAVFLGQKQRVSHPVPQILMLNPKSDIAPTGRPKKTSSIAAAADALVAAAASNDGSVKPKKTSSIAAAADALVAAAASNDGSVKRRPESLAQASVPELPSANLISKAANSIESLPVNSRATANRHESRKVNASSAVHSQPDDAAAGSASHRSAVTGTSATSNASKHPATAPAYSFFSSATPAAFADDAFDMDSFLLRAAAPNSDIHSLSPAELRASLVGMLESVQKMEAQARGDLQNNETSFADVELIRTSEVEACENELDAMLDRLRVLTSSVTNIWGKSRGTADLLITADRQRTRAAEAVEIIEWFERIKEERLLNVHKEIVNPTACWGFAHLVHGLAAFARDLRVSGCATAVADVQQLEELFERCRHNPIPSPPTPLSPLL
jgi:hypothetical protein